MKYKNIVIVIIAVIIVTVPTCLFMKNHYKQEESETVPTKELLNESVESKVLALTNTDGYKNSDISKKEEMLAEVLNQFVESGEIKSYTIELDLTNPCVSYINLNGIRKAIMLQPFKENQN